MEIQPRDAEQVYVDIAEGGRLAEVHVKPGQQVNAGPGDRRAGKHDLDLEIAKLEAKQRQYKIQLENLRAGGRTTPRSAAEIPQIDDALKTVQRATERKREDRKRMRLTAGAAARCCRRRITPRRSTRTPRANCRPGAGRRWTRRTATPI